MVNRPSTAIPPQPGAGRAADSSKSRGQLLKELADLRARVAELEGAAVERNQAVEQIRRGEERTHALASAAPVGVFLTDTKGNCLYANQRWCQMAGLEPDQALGTGWLTAIHPDDRQRVSSDWYHLAEMEDNWSLEYRLQTPQGRATWVYGFANAIHDDKARLTGFLGINVDIGEQRKSEESLRSLSRAVEESPVTIIITDSDGVIQYANPRFTELTGYPISEAIGQRPAFQKSGQTPPERYKELWAALRAGKPWKGEFINRKKNGELYLELASISPITDRAGVVTNFVGVKEDISERRRAEETIAASLREKELLLREIHHRVKNNLQVIASLVTLQANAVHDPAALQALRQTQNRIRAMSLIHAKLYQSENLAKVDFGSFVRDLGVILLRAYLADPSRIILDVTVHETGLPLDSIIPCGLIVNELLANCVRHAFPDARRGKITVGLVTVGLVEEKDTFRLTVADDGIGFPADVDFRNTASLGLQLVNMLTEQLEGTVDMDSTAGTTFTITFPVPGRQQEATPLLYSPQSR